MLKSFKLSIQAIAFLFLVFLLSGCSEQLTRVIIFHTNDSHGHIDQFPQIAYLVEQEKLVNPHVFLVSAGDIFSGNPMVDNYDPPGFPKIDLMNRVGYDLTTIGNHEFDYGIEVLKNRMDQAEFPFILANVDVGETNLLQPAPYFVANAGRLSIAFIGIVQLNNQGIPSTHPDRVKGMHFENPIEKVGEFFSLTQKSDAVITLSHHGFLKDTIMAYKYPWLDVIIGGHSHTLVTNPRSFNNVLVTQAGNNLTHIGKVTLVFEGSKLKEKFAEMISLEELEGQNEELALLVKQYNDNPVLNRIIGRLKSPVDGKQNLGCLTTDAYRKFAGLDFAFQNYGGIRIDRLEGDISLKDIYKMDPFGNELIQQELSYSDIRSLIINSLSSAGYPIVQISGGIIELSQTKDKKYRSLKIFDHSGNELKSGQKYKVGMPSYVASAFSYEQDTPGMSLGITTAQVVIDYISERGEIDFIEEERIRLIKVDE